MASNTYMALLTAAISASKRILCHNTEYHFSGSVSSLESQRKRSNDPLSTSGRTDEMAGSGARSTATSNMAIFHSIPALRSAFIQTYTIAASKKNCVERKLHLASFDNGIFVSILTMALSGDKEFGPVSLDIVGWLGSGGAGGWGEGGWGGRVYLWCYGVGLLNCRSGSHRLEQNFLHNLEFRADLYL